MVRDEGCAAGSLWWHSKAGAGVQSVCNLHHSRAEALPTLRIIHSCISIASTTELNLSRCSLNILKIHVSSIIEHGCYVLSFKTTNTIQIRIILPLFPLILHLLLSIFCVIRPSGDLYYIYMRQCSLASVEEYKS